MVANLGRVAVSLMDMARWNNLNNFPTNTKHFAGSQRADEPGSAEPKLQRVPVQILYDHGGVWIWVNMPVCTWQYGTFFVPPLFFWNAFLRNWGGTRRWVRCQEWVVWGVATKITGQSCSLKIEIKICEQCLAVTWELMVRAPHPHNGRQCFARITRRMAGCFQILICFMSIGWWLVSGVSLVDDANLHTGSWNSELWLRITCSWTHKYNHCQCYIVSWLKFSSTRPSCVRTLRKGAQEIVHRYTTFLCRYSEEKLPICHLF